MDQNNKTRDKWVSAILSILLPGVGHFYLGYLGRGLAIIGAFILDIALITFSSFMIVILFPLGIALVTLFGLALPVIYFFSIFDALQLAERKHTYNDPFAVTTGERVTIGEEPEWPDEILQTPHTQSSQNGSRAVGIALIVIGVMLLIGFLLPNPLLIWVFDNIQVLFAVLLLACGGWLMWEQQKDKKGDHS